MDLVIVFLLPSFQLLLCEGRGGEQSGAGTPASWSPEPAKALPLCRSASWRGREEGVGGGSGSQPVPHRFPLTPGRWAGWPCTGLQVRGTSRLCGCSWSTRLLWMMRMRYGTLRRHGCVCMSVCMSVSGQGRGARAHSRSTSRLSLPRLPLIRRRPGTGWAGNQSVQGPVTLN